MVMEEIIDAMAQMTAENEEPSKLVVGRQVYEQLKSERGERYYQRKFYGMDVVKSNKLKPDDWFIIPRGQTLGFD